MKKIPSKFLDKLKIRDYILLKKRDEQWIGIIMKNFYSQENCDKINKIFNKMDKEYGNYL